MNRNHPGSWGHDHTSAHGCVHRDISAVIGPIRVFDCFSVALVVGLLSFVGVVLVIVIAMGLSGGADTDASDSNQKRSNAETLGK